MKALGLISLTAVLALAAAAQWRKVEPPRTAGQRPAAAEQPQASDQEPVIRMDVALVNVTCSVRNRNGGLVGNLTKDDFEVREDGKPQTIKYFAREVDLPLTLGLLVDVSRSQERLIEVEKDAAMSFFQQVLRPKDLAFLMSFGSEAELLQDFTNSPRLLRAGLDGLKVNSDVSGVHPGPVPTVYHPRGTVLFDAVYLAAREQLKNQVGRKAIVLITDGVDQGSRVKLEEALRAAHLSDVIVYSIQYYDPSGYGYGGWNAGGAGDHDLKKMAEETGGRLFRVDRKHTLADIFKQLQEELRSQYALGYTPTTARDGEFHKIEVKVRDKDMKVQARKGYFAGGA